MAARRPLVNVSGTTQELPVGDTIIGGSAGSGTVITSGGSTIDFGSIPGTNLVSTVVTGQTEIVTTSVVKAWITPIATATHNETEHLIAPIKVGITNIINGTGFTINAMSKFRLTGTFTVQWEWY